MHYTLMAEKEAVVCWELQGGRHSNSRGREINGRGGGRETERREGE